MNIKLRIKRFWFYVQLGWLLVSRWFYFKMEAFKNWVETNKEKGKEMQKKGWEDLQEALNNGKK